VEFKGKVCAASRRGKTRRARCGDKKGGTFFSRKKDGSGFKSSVEASAMKQRTRALPDRPRGGLG